MTSRMAGSSGENRRIDSWKEIAAFFGRDERTVKRWEKERGLPIHRLPGERGGVFAWPHELNAWLHSAAANSKGKEEPAAGPTPDVPPAAANSSTEPVPGRTVAPGRAMPIRIGASIVLLALVATGILAVRFRHWPLHVASGSRAASSHHVPDPEAQEYYLKGRYYWSRRTEGSLRQAIDAFTQAVVHDSSDAQAYAGLAECYALMPEFSAMPRSEAYPRAIAAARKAVALDDSLAEAHRALGFALFYWEWNVPAALEEYRRAIELDPRDEEAHHWYATSLLTLGRYQDARIEIDRARQLDPASRSILSDQALIRFRAGDPGRAIEKLREIEQAEPDFFSAPRYLAVIAFAQRDYRTFVEQTKRLATISNDAQLLAVANAAQRGLAKGGERGMLEAMRTAQQQSFESHESSGFELARTCALLGRKQEAVTYLKAAVADHDYMVLTIASDKDFGPLRGDPGFEDLQRQINARLSSA